MKRPVHSTTRNNVERFGRHNHKDSSHFIKISRGSIYDVLDDLLIAEIEGYVSKEEVAKGKELIEKSLKLTKGYIRYLESLIKRK